MAIPSFEALDRYDVFPIEIDGALTVCELDDELAGGLDDELCDEFDEELDEEVDDSGSDDELFVSDSDDD